MLTLFFMFGLPVPEPLRFNPSVEKEVVADCSKWMAGRAPDSPTETKEVEGGICFDGDITQASADTFLQAFAKEAGPTVVVIKSDGGDVKSSLDMAEAISSHETSVVANYKCISSCANYILAAGKRRVVLTDTVLLFHGGANLDHIEENMDGVRKYYAEHKLPDPEKNMIKAMTDLTELVHKQDAFLQKVGISKAFFRWMDLFNYMGVEDQAKHCTNPDSQVVLLPPTVLATFGYRIDDYRGPTTESDLLDTLKRLQRTENAKDICVWR